MRNLIMAFALLLSPAAQASVDVEKYPAFSAWEADTGGDKKACAPKSWGLAALYVPPNIPNLVACLGNNETDIEAKEILNEGPANPDFILAVIYVIYQIMYTDPKTGETDGWWLSQPLVRGIWSGDQIRPGEDVLRLVEESALDGMPSIIWVNGVDYDHLWLVTGLGDEGFEVYPGKVYDFYGGDFGPFEKINRDMNFCNIRPWDGSRAETQEEIYGDDGGLCFMDSVSN